MTEEERGPWYLLTGLILGIAMGLLYAWVIAPTRYTDTAPASLRTDFKSQYRALISVAYLSSGKVDRAQKRLAEIKDADVLSSLSQQALAWNSGSNPPSEISALNLLVKALSGSSPQQPEGAPSAAPSEPAPTPTTESAPTATFTQVIVLQSELDTTPSPEPSSTATLRSFRVTATPIPANTATPTVTITPLPTRTPTPTPGGLFTIQEQSLVCNASLTEPLIQVFVLDASQKPVPGMEIVVRWPGGEDHFYTGLKPEIGLGYADFSMTPGTTYEIQLMQGSQVASELSPTECEASGGGRFWGSWRVVYIQP